MPITDLDTVICLALQFSAFLYSVTLAVKMFGSDIKLRANQLILVSICGGMIVSAMCMTSSMFTLENTHADDAGVLFSFAVAVVATQVVSLVVLLDMRNRILMRENTVLVLSRLWLAILFLSILLDTIPFWIY